MEERETIIIPEKKKKIEKIKKKYQNLSMSDNTAEKIMKLEVLNKNLVLASSIAGVVTVIDIFLPDPILGLDEIALAGITTLLSTASKYVNNKINDLVVNDEAKLNIDEVSNLSKIAVDIAKNIKNGKGKK